MEDKIYLGKITSTHGIKGELKIKSDFEKKDIVFKIGFNIYINEEPFVITSYRSHKNFDMVTINNIYDINEVYKYVSSDVYIKRSDLKLSDNDYLLFELINYIVKDGEEIIGTVKEVISSPAHNLLKVVDEVEFYIPFIEAFIDRVDTQEKEIITKNGKDFIL